MNLDKILNLALNKALIGKNRIKQANSNEIADFVNKHLEAINYTHCSTQLKAEKIMKFDEWQKNNGWEKAPYNMFENAKKGRRSNLINLVEEYHDYVHSF